jgi:hypothetical protein
MGYKWFSHKKPALKAQTTRSRALKYLVLGYKASIGFDLEN